MGGRFSLSDGEARDFFGIPNIYVAVIHTYSTPRVHYQEYATHAKDNIRQ